ARITVAPVPMGDRACFSVTDSHQQGGSGMKITGVISIGIFALFLDVGLSYNPVFAADDPVETGRLLAVLHDSGRVTIGANQSLINDPDKGDKGFTPDVFEKQVTEKFKDRA